MPSTAVASPPRLPMPANAGIDPGRWRVLVEAVFPSAQSSDAVMLALDYCKARGLDIMRRPVNIVPMWNSQLGRSVETIWPAIGEIQVTAARTKEWAGMDPPEWGPMVTQTFEGRRKGRQGWEDSKTTVTFPESCSVTVYRLIGGARCAFVEPVFWREAYGRIGGSQLPNDMWCKRPHGQLHKVAKAASLRSAFPEEADYSDTEMADATIDVTPPAPPAPAPADAWTPPGEQDERPEPSEPHDPETGEVIDDGAQALPRQENEEWREWSTRFIAKVRSATTAEQVDAWVKPNERTLVELLQNAPKVHTLLVAAIGRHRVALASEETPPQ